MLPSDMQIDYQPAQITRHPLNGRVISHSMHVLTAHVPHPEWPDKPSVRRTVGELHLDGIPNNGGHRVAGVAVDARYRRQGVGKALWEHAQQLGLYPKHEDMGIQTPDGKSWAASTPEDGPTVPKEAHASRHRAAKTPSPSQSMGRAVSGLLPSLPTSSRTAVESPEPTHLPNGDHVGHYGDASGEQYNEVLGAHHKDTGEYSGQLATSILYGGHHVNWMETPNHLHGRGTMVHLLDHYRKHVMQPGDTLHWGMQTDEGSDWIKKHGAGHGLQHSHVLTDEGRAWSEKVAGAQGDLPHGVEIRQGGPGELEDSYPWRSAREGEREVRAHLDGKIIGQIKWMTHDSPRVNSLTQGHITHAGVHPDYHRRGVASEMLRRAREVDPNVHHSPFLTDDGNAWSEKVGSVQGDPYFQHLLTGRFSTAFTAEGFDHSLLDNRHLLRTGALHDIVRPKVNRDMYDSWRTDDEKRSIADDYAKTRSDFIGQVRQHEAPALDHVRDSEVEDHWNQGMHHALTMGHLNIDEAEKRGYHSGNRRETGDKVTEYDKDDNRVSRRIGGWQKLPSHVIHVSTNADAIAQQGLKTPEEQGRGSKSTLGLGGGSDTVSVTSDHKLAPDIYHNLHEHHAAVTGKITPQDLLDYADHPPAGKPFGKDLRGQFLSDKLDHIIRGVTGNHDLPYGDRSNPGLATVRKAKGRHPEWTPVESSKMSYPEDGPQPEAYTHWERPSTPSELHTNRSELYKRFSSLRQNVGGGHRDPLFISNDPYGFSQTDPKKFGILHLRPHPNAQGYPLDGNSGQHHTHADSGEWRLGRGSPFDVDHIDKPTPRHLAEFGLDKTGSLATHKEFDQLAPHEQEAASTYHEQMIEDKQAQPHETPRDYKYEMRQEPVEHFLHRYMDADNEFTSQYGPHEFPEHHAETLANHPIPHHPANNRWPVIVNDSNPNYVDDGYHRFHSYMRDGATHIPTMRMHHVGASSSGAGTRRCPCGMSVEHDPINGWQHSDGSISHDGEFYGKSVSDLVKDIPPHTVSRVAHPYDPDCRVCNLTPSSNPHLAARVIPPGYHNPEGGHHWYHGASFAPPSEEDVSERERDPDGGGRLDNERAMQNHEYESASGGGYNGRENKHWNTDLGVHFTSLHHVARNNFAGLKFGAYGDPTLSRVAHASLHMANPKHYNSEYAMDRHAIRWALRNNMPHKDVGGLGHDVYEEGDEDYPDDRETHTATGRDHHINEYGPGDLREDANDNETWLRRHPERHAIVHGFRQHLIDKGHDGIIYGNEYEGPRLHHSAIAFPTTPVTLHKWEWLHPDHPDHEPQQHHDPNQLKLPFDKEVMATDWSKHYDTVPHEVHRGLFVPNSHDAFTYPASDEDIAHHLIHIHHEEHQPYGGDGKEFGTHWTTDHAIAKSFAEDHEQETKHGDYDTGYDEDHHSQATPVIFHAEKPPSHHIEKDERRLGWQNIDDYHTHEREVPFAHGAPIHIKGVSWRVRGPEHPWGEMWHRHDLKDPVTMRAHDRDSPNDPTQFNASLRSQAMGQAGPDYNHLTFKDMSGEEYGFRPTMHRPRRILLARHPEDGYVGRVHYTPADTENPLRIHNLSVNDEHQRRGVASQLIGELERLHPNTVIDHGSRTDQGREWARSYYGDSPRDLSQPYARPKTRNRQPYTAMGQAGKTGGLLTRTPDDDSKDYYHGYGHGLIGDYHNHRIFTHRLDSGKRPLDPSEHHYLLGHAAGVEEAQQRERKRAETGQYRCNDCRGSGKGSFDRTCHGCGGYGGISAHEAQSTDTLYHVTDNPHFTPNPDHIPEDNAIAVNSRSSPGLFAARGQDVSHWTHGQQYVRPYVAEFHVPRFAHEPGRWGGERFIPSQHFDKVKVNRVIPLSAHEDEQYEDKPYSGPDARRMSPQEHATHKQHALDTLKNNHDFSDDDIKELRQRWASLSHESSRFIPTTHVFVHTDGLDFRLFDHDDHLRPEVRADIVSRFTAFCERHQYKNWLTWGKIVFFGSEASNWTSKDLIGNGDFDLSLGILYPVFRAVNPQYSALDDTAIASMFTEQMHQELNDPDHWYMTEQGKVGPFDQTWFANKRGYLIEEIRPYAAWDVGADVWIVKPPNLPNWSWSQVPPGVQKVLRDSDKYARDVLALPEPQRTQEGARLFNDWHADRSEGFSQRGDGWWSIPNLRMKMLEERGSWQKLVECARRWQAGEGTSTLWDNSNPFGVGVTSLRRQAMAWQDHGGMDADKVRAKSVRDAGFAGYVSDDQINEQMEYGPSDSEEDEPDHEDPHLHHFVRGHGSDSDWWRKHEPQPQNVDLSRPVYATQSHVGQLHIDRYKAKPHDESWHTQQHGMNHDYLGEHHPMFITHQGRLHVTEGHHRVAAALQQGKSHIEGWHYDLDKHPIGMSIPWGTRGNKPKPCEDCKEWQGEQSHTSSHIAMGQAGPDYDNLEIHHEIISQVKDAPEYYDGKFIAHHPEHGEVGSLTYGHNPMGTSRGDVNVASVTMLRVNRNHERRGVGTQLMNAMEDHFHDTPINHGTRTHQGEQWGRSMYPNIKPSRAKTRDGKPDKWQPETTKYYGPVTKNRRPYSLNSGRYLKQVSYPSDSRTAGMQMVRPSQFWGHTRDLSLPHHQRQVNELASSIAEHGYDEDLANRDLPIHVSYDPDGTPAISNGHRRLKAMEQIGYDKSVPMQVSGSSTVITASLDDIISRPTGPHADFFHKQLSGTLTHVKYPEEVNHPLYHGTKTEFSPGDHIEPGHPGNFVRSMSHVYSNEDPQAVRSYAYGGQGNSGPHVYEVTPTGPIGHRRDAKGQNWASRYPYRVVREVSQDELGPHTAALSDEDRVSVAEQVMGRAGQTGRQWHVPAIHRELEADHPDHQAVNGFVHHVLRSNGHSRAAQIRVAPKHWDLRNGGSDAGNQAFTDGHNTIGLASEHTNDMTLLHECAHILTGTHGHGPDFQNTVHRLYHDHLGPEAAQTFAGVAMPHTAMGHEASKADDIYGSNDISKLFTGDGPITTAPFPQAPRSKKNWDYVQGIVHEALAHPEHHREAPGKPPDSSGGR